MTLSVGDSASLSKTIHLGRVRLRTTCTNHKGEVVIDGEAVVLPPRAKDVP